MGQALGNLGLEGVGRDFAVGSIIGTQVLLIINLADEDDHLLESVDLEHHVLDLAQLDAQAAQLDLVVGTAQDHDITIGQPLGIVARLIDALAVVVHKALARHLLQVVVAMGHATATDVELADDPHRQLVAVLVHDEFLDIQLGLAHGHDVGMGQLLVIGSHRGLGGTVAVEDACLGHFPESREQLVREFLTTGTHDADAADGIAEVLTREPGHPARRGARHHVDVLLIDEAGQVKRIVGLLLGSDDKRLAVEVGSADVLQGGVKRDGGHAQHAAGIGHHTVGKHVGRMSVQVVADAAVMQHHALGTAR